MIPRSSPLWTALSIAISLTSSLSFAGVTMPGGTGAAISEPIDVDGTDFVECHRGLAEALAWVKGGKGPAMVHAECVRIGAHSMTAMCSLLFADQPPFVMSQGQPAEARSMNFEGLRRRGFSPQRIAAVKGMHKALYRDGFTLSQSREAIEAISKTSPESAPDVEMMLTFLNKVSGERGIVRQHGAAADIHKRALGLAQQVDVLGVALPTAGLQVGPEGGRLGVDHQVPHHAPEPAPGQGDHHVGQAGAEGGPGPQQEPVPGPQEPGKRVGGHQPPELVGRHRGRVGPDHPVHEAHSERDAGRIGDQPVDGDARAVVGDADQDLAAAMLGRETDDALRGLRELNFSTPDACMFFPRLLAPDRLRGTMRVRGTSRPRFVVR